jgi:hypothetical protein
MGEGWRLAGTAVVTEGGVPAALSYEVRCTEDWVTTDATVHGQVGHREVACSVQRTTSGWLLNGAAVPGLSDAVDIDLAFSPATNLLPLRRLDLVLGQSRSVVSAWLRYPELDLVPLPQRYTRIAANVLRYESPSEGFTAALVLHESGFPREYPGLWRLVCTAG